MINSSKNEKNDERRIVGETDYVTERFAYDHEGREVTNDSASIEYAPSAPPRETTYDLDGNMLSDGVLSFTYDAASRLKTVSSNGVTLVTNFYDAKSRRVRKVTTNATMTFFYDDWNLIEERVAYTNGTTSTIRYYWGKDLSGSFQGAGGVGGLLWLTIDSVVYIPCYDNNGNITRYLDVNGKTVAQYTYDAFGKLIAMDGRCASLFRHRFSTKYCNAEMVCESLLEQISVFVTYNNELSLLYLYLVGNIIPLEQINLIIHESQ